MLENIFISNKILRIFGRCTTRLFGDQLIVSVEGAELALFRNISLRSRQFFTVVKPTLKPVLN